MGDRRILRTLLETRASGNRVFDLQIALCAFEGGAGEVWSHDARFVTMPGLRLVRALAYIVRKELGLPAAESLGADPKLSLIRTM